MIPTRRFGRHDDEVTIVAVGCGHIVRPGTTFEQSVAIVRAAIDRGVNFIDTAWDYGEGSSELRVGAAIEGQRDELFVATKVCARDRVSAEAQINESLERLRTDRVDLLSLHEINYDNDPEWCFAPEGAFEALLDARAQGKTRYIGFTGHKHPAILVEMLGRFDGWDAVQMPINVYDASYRSFINQVLPIVTERGMACIGMKSLGGNGQFIRDGGLTAQDCRRFALSQPITTLSCGMTDLRDLDQDIAIGENFEPFTAREMRDFAHRVRNEARDGRHEWFKTNNFFDNWYHREQHGYPDVADVRSALGLK